MGLTVCFKAPPHYQRCKARLAELAEILQEWMLALQVGCLRPSDGYTFDLTATVRNPSNFIFDSLSKWD